MMMLDSLTGEYVDVVEEPKDPNKEYFQANLDSFKIIAKPAAYNKKLSS